MRFVSETRQKPLLASDGILPVIHALVDKQKSGKMSLREPVDFGRIRGRRHKLGKKKTLVSRQCFLSRFANKVDEMRILLKGI